MTTTSTELIARKQAGGDSTEEESVWILRYFDTHHPIESAEGRAVADAYPLENDQWQSEYENGDRPGQRAHEENDQ